MAVVVVVLVEQELHLTTDLVAVALLEELV
jgi:hypothetical protein